MNEEHQPPAPFASGFSVNRANKDFTLECIMNEGRLIQNFCSAALRAHVPEYMLALYGADNKQIPGLFLNVTKLAPMTKGDAHLSIVLGGREIAAADVIHTLSSTTFVVTLANVTIQPCQSSPAASGS